MGVQARDDVRDVLRTVELAALRTAESAGTAYRRMAGVVAFRPNGVAPLRDGIPATPLVAAVGDLASAAHAAARAIHFAAETSPPYRPDAATRLAVAISRAATVAVEAANHRADTAATAMRLELAHAAAFAAHSAATALEPDDPLTPVAPRRARMAASPAASFPRSSRRLIQLLSASIDAESRGRDLEQPGPTETRLGAARAARDAAAHAMVAHDRCTVNAAPVRVMCGVARLASRASALAGFAALGRPA
jgi:hypothetical protein